MTDDLLKEWTHRLVVGDMIARETELRALVQPKPRWLPERLWRRVLARLLVIEEKDAP